jgi:hypothetical protein
MGPDQERRDRVETIKGDARDTLDEVKERAKAGAERAKRAVEGEQMPLGERVASRAKEAAHNLKADVDKTKREVRDDATREEGV